MDDQECAWKGRACAYGSGKPFEITRGIVDRQKERGLPSFPHQLNNLGFDRGIGNALWAGIWSLKWSADLKLATESKLEPMT